ncbi:MAG: isochorismatase, partial [Solirubrobacteraceae bacterium]
ASPAAMTQLTEQTAGCVWELEVIDFERRAWLADVLTNPGGPDVERYLSRQTNTEI